MHEINLLKPKLPPEGFNTWPLRMDRATKRGEFTSSDLVAANDWLTCAVGELGLTVTLNGAIPPSASSWRLPMPGRVHELGLGFADAVKCDDIDGARRAYLELLEIKAEHDDYVGFTTTAGVNLCIECSAFAHSKERMPEPLRRSQVSEEDRCGLCGWRLAGPPYSSPEDPTK